MTRVKALGVIVVFAGTVTALRAYQVFQAGGMDFLDIFLLLSQTNSYAVYVVMLGVATKTYPYPLLFLFLATAAASRARSRARAPRARRSARSPTLERHPIAPPR